MWKDELPTGLSARLENELYESVIPFWMRHSPDRENGGYYNCLDRDGGVYDTRKHVWLQGRQVWMFAKLYAEVDQRPEWLEMARLGADFLETHARREDGRVFFSLTEQGRPLSMQRKIFSECFYVMAMAQYARATGSARHEALAKSAFAQVWEWSKDLRLVGRPRFEGETPSHGLAIPMILLNLIEEVSGDHWRDYEAEVDDCIRQMLLHVHPATKTVYETVSPEGERLSGYDGRMLMPGHAIEAGWFLQHWARRLGRDDLGRIAVDMVRWSHDRGWDPEYGGLFYMVDAEGYSPVALEWDMKLWWPHNEAMYAHLLNFSITGDRQDLDRFDQVWEWAWSRFPDPGHGEWFGYLNRRGEVTHRFKGGPYKGCFHVPRALWLCDRLLHRGS